MIPKIRKNNKFKFSPREKAIRKLNSICSKDKQLSDINNNYYLMSRALKVFILDLLGIKNKEMTTMELLDILSKETNVFHKAYPDILNLFTIYNNAKYSIETLSLKDFFDVFNKTKQMIESLSVSIKKD